MSRLSGQSDIDSVRDATDLVRLIGEHIALRPKGREHVGLCPFHDDRAPSFTVVTHKGNAFYKCHACGAGGDAFDFVMNYHRMEFGEALRFLADRAGITLRPRSATSAFAGEGEVAAAKRTDIRKANQFAATFFQRVLRDPAAGAAAREMIAKRGISEEIAEAFMLGAAPDQWDALLDLIRRRGLSESVFAAAGLLKPRKEGQGFYDAFRNRLIFPICDDAGAPIAFGARKIDPDDEPKYLNSAESSIFSKSKTLYGLHRAKRAIIDSNQAIITEGYTDVIACHQAGICNVVGTLGTALTRDHAQKLSTLCDSIVLLFDGDAAGQRASGRGFGVLANHYGLEAFFHATIDVKVCVLPDDLDPDEMLKQPGGVETLLSLLRRSRDMLEFMLDGFRQRFAGAQGLSARQKLVEAFLSELVELGFAKVQGLRRSLILNRLADLLKVAPAELDRDMPKTMSNAVSKARPVSSSVEQDSPVQSRTDLEPSGASPTPLAARIRAERELLAILIFQPELHIQTVPALDGGESPLTRIVTTDHFADPLSRMLAATMFRYFAASQTFTVQQLLNEIDQPEARTLISSLYFDGERLCERSPAAPGESASATQSLRSAALSLQAHIRLHHYQLSITQFRQCKDAPDQAIRAAQAVIEQRRRQGHIASAIVRGARS